MNRKRSSFSGMMFMVSRLVRVENIVRRKVLSKLGSDNIFDDFGYESWRLDGSLRVGPCPGWISTPNVI